MPTPADMSDYERKAWDALLNEATKQHEPGRFDNWSHAIKVRAKQTATGVRTRVSRVPGGDAAIERLDAMYTKALAGLHIVLVGRGLNSVKPAAVFKMFADEGITVWSYDEIQRLDLKTCDHSVPRRRERYIALATAEGVASSLAVTGPVVSSTVTGGATAPMVVAAVVADVTTVLVGMGRIVALIAAHYGYDVREPDEQVFASGVIAFSAAGNSAEKAAALASLSRLTQQMMRQATWRQLQQHQLVNVIRAMSTSLGFRMTKRKLAQAVPFAGAVVNGGLNARIAYKTFQRAQQAYRLRFLTEKYNLDPQHWAPNVVDVEATEVPLVDEVLDAELATDPVEESPED